MPSILALFSLAGSAHAGTTEHWYSLSNAAPSPDTLTITASCPRGSSLVGGGAGMSDGLPLYLATSLSSTSSAYTGRWQRAPRTPVPGETSRYVSAVCTTDASCLERNSLATGIDSTDSKTLTLLCDPGTYAIGGGFSITGDTRGVEVHESGSVGLFAPIGWRVRARELAEATRWGLSVEVRCVPASVFGEVTAMGPNVGGIVSLWSGLPGYGWPSVGAVKDANFDASPGWLLSLGARTVAEGGLLSLGPRSTYAPASYWSAGSNLFGSNLTVGTENEHALFTADPVAFGDALRECVPEEPQYEPPYFEIGGDIWFGVIEGGGGVIFLPGRGPVPVDPEPFREAFAALPAIVTPYVDAHSRDAQIDEIGAGLDAERTPWVVLDDVSRTTEIDFIRGVGVVIVVPRDEAADVAWMSANRERLASLDHPTIVALEIGGAGMDELEAW